MIMGTPLVELLSLPEAINRGCGPTKPSEIIAMGMNNAWKLARECAESLGCKLFADAGWSEQSAWLHRNDK